MEGYKVSEIVEFLVLEVVSQQGVRQFLKRIYYC